MNERVAAAQDVPGPCDRVATLVVATLRIGASLDLDNVLRGVVVGARALSGARYGVVATIDDAGQPRDVVTAGFTPGEHRAMEAWPD